MSLEPLMILALCANESRSSSGISCPLPYPPRAQNIACDVGTPEHFEELASTAFVRGPEKYRKEEMMSGRK